MLIHLTNDARTTIVDDADVSVVGAHQWMCFEGTPGYPYVATYIGGRMTFLHRLLTGAPRGLVVDHVNGDGLDNRRLNLRVCTHAQNMRNRKHNKNGVGHYKGVWRDRRRNNNRYRAEIYANGKRFALGWFDGEKLAAEAYDDAAIQLHGEFARLNFPDRKKFSRSKPLNATQLGC